MNTITEPQKCDVYSRVVGYFRPVDNWNKGKRAEFEDRVEYVIEEKQIQSDTQSLKDWQSKPTKCIVFTTPMCPNCHLVKQEIEQKKFPFELIDASSENGFELAKKYTISSVPAAVFIDDSNEIVSIELGFEHIEKYLHAL